jgi:hypothetical protein
MNKIFVLVIEMRFDIRRGPELLLLERNSRVYIEGFAFVTCSSFN